LNCERELPAILDRFELSLFALGESHVEEDARFDAALVEGAVSTPQDLATLFALRSASRYLIAFGTCALYGGVAAMNNQVSQRIDLVQAVYGADAGVSGIPPAPFVNLARQQNLWVVG
jgi:coenzyme F420-reducing hydrogenase gamma subunit